MDFEAANNILAFALQVDDKTKQSRLSTLAPTSQILQRHTDTQILRYSAVDTDTRATHTQCRRRHFDVPRTLSTLEFVATWRPPPHYTHIGVSIYLDTLHIYCNSLFTRLPFDAIHWPLSNPLDFIPYYRPTTRHVRSDKMSTILDASTRTSIHIPIDRSSNGLIKWQVIYLVAANSKRCFGMSKVKQIRSNRLESV